MNASLRNSVPSVLQTLEIAGMIALAVFVVDSFFSVINKKRRDLEELHAEKK